jgi:AraC family transcriptional activator of pobA
MKKARNNPAIINSITEMHRRNNMPDPEHPMVSVVHFNEIVQSPADYSEGCVLNFYMIAMKKDFKGKIRYGQSYYDFDEGIMSFIAPGQLCWEDPSDRPRSGSMLLFHADFLRGFPLNTGIKDYTFFSYAINEALYLSAKEEAMITNIFKSIEQEYKSNIDNFSQSVMISHMEVLLNYANRFYNRQFITRKPIHNDLLLKLEALLDEYFDNDQKTGLPTVKEVAEQLNVSADYLSDLLRSNTGQNTQQHIHNKLIEKAKAMLTASNKTIAEIAYQLGFEHPQSFNKVFKQKTDLSPLQFRQSFN